MSKDLCIINIMHVYNYVHMLLYVCIDAHSYVCMCI